MISSTQINFNEGINNLLRLTDEVIDSLSEQNAKQSLKNARDFAVRMFEEARRLFQAIQMEPNQMHLNELMQVRGDITRMGELLHEKFIRDVNLADIRHSTFYNDRLVTISERSLNQVRASMQHNLGEYQKYVYGFQQAIHSLVKAKAECTALECVLRTMEAESERKEKIRAAINITRQEENALKERKRKLRQAMLSHEEYDYFKNAQQPTIMFQPYKQHRKILIPIEEQLNLDSQMNRLTLKGQEKEEESEEDE